MDETETLVLLGAGYLAYRGASGLLSGVSGVLSGATNAFQAAGTDLDLLTNAPASVISSTSAAISSAIKQEEAAIFSTPAAIAADIDAPGLAYSAIGSAVSGLLTTLPFGLGGLIQTEVDFLKGVPLFG